MTLALYRRSLFPSLFKDVFGEDFLSPLFDDEGKAFWQPAVDIYDKNGVLTLKVELPGVDKKDLKVEYSDGVLTIAGEKKSQHETKGENYFARERVWGSFSRSFRIGEAYNPESIKAKFKNGVLTLTMEKKEQKKPLSIKIEG